MKINITLCKGEIQTIIDALYTEQGLIEIVPENLTNTKKMTEHYEKLDKLRNKLDDILL